MSDVRRYGLREGESGGRGKRGREGGGEIEGERKIG